MASDTPAGQPATLPAAAVQAAADAMRQAGRENPIIGIPVEDVARRALEAAAPHLAAAERERLATWLEGPEARAVTAAAIKADVEQQITEGVAAAQARAAELHALATDVLSRFTPTGDGHRARAGQVQIAKWQAVLDGGSGE